MKADSAIGYAAAIPRHDAGFGASFSHDIYGIDWSNELPIQLGHGVTLEHASTDDALAFTRANYARIFGMDPADQRFFVDAQTPARLRFLAASDRFLFREAGETIGLLIGNPIDWSTYYWRSVAFLPEHQGRGLLAVALEHTDRVMRGAGIVRVEGEAAPNNYKQVRLLLRLGYCVTGSVNSERWGTLLRLTKYLDASAEHKFVTQFCRDTFLARSSPSDRPTEGGSHEEVRRSDDVNQGEHRSPRRPTSGVYLRRKT